MWGYVLCFFGGAFFGFVLYAVVAISRDERW